MIVVLKGKMASGKSTLAKFLSDQFEFEIFDCDKEVHEVYSSDNEVSRSIMAEFDMSNGIDRVKLGDIVFNDSEKLKKLESIVYPYLRDLIVARNSDRLVVDGYDGSLLGIDYDLMLITSCDRPTLVSRALKREKMSLEKINAVLDQQSISMQIKQKTYVIDTTTDYSVIVEKIIRSFDASSNWKNS